MIRWIIRPVEAVILMSWGWKGASDFIGETKTGETNAGGQIFNGALSQGQSLVTTLSPRVVNPNGAHVWI